MTQLLQKTLTKLETRKPTTLVALGDSITENTFHTRGCMNWVSLLDEALLRDHVSSHEGVTSHA